MEETIKDMVNITDSTDNKGQQESQAALELGNIDNQSTIFSAINGVLLFLGPQPLTFSPRLHLLFYGLRPKYFFAAPMYQNYFFTAPNYQNDYFTALLVENISCISVLSKFQTFQWCILLRLKSRSVRGASHHAIFMGNWSHVFSLIYPVDECSFKK